LKSVYALLKQAALQPGGIRRSIAWRPMVYCRETTKASVVNVNWLSPKQAARFLSEHWIFSLQSYVELDSVLRATAVALRMGGVGSTPVPAHASIDRDRAAKQRELEAEAEALLKFNQQLKEEKHVHQQRVFPAVAQTVPPQRNGSMRPVIADHGSW
jgi:hypothetical protein